MTKQIADELVAASYGELRAFDHRDASGEATVAVAFEYRGDLLVAGIGAAERIAQGKACGGISAFDLTQVLRSLRYDRMGREEVAY